MTDNKALADRLFDALRSYVSPADVSHFRRAIESTLTATPSAQAGEVVDALESLAERWMESVRGKDGSRRIATIDESNPALAMRGEDDFDNEVFAVRRCARDVEKLARRFAATPQPQGDASPEVSGGGDDHVSVLRHLRGDCGPDDWAGPALDAAIAALSTPQARPEGIADLVRRQQPLGDDFAQATAAGLEAMLDGEPAPTVDGGAMDVPRVIPREGMALLVHYPAPQAALEQEPQE